MFLNIIDNERYITAVAFSSHRNNRMPMILTLTEGALPASTISRAVSELTLALLKWNGLTGNKIIASDVTSTVQVVPKGLTFSDGKEFSGVWVEWKVPSFAYVKRETQEGFFNEVKNILHDLSGRK